jgi:uncharacterized repeat protein (TIGR03803 family)
MRWAAVSAALALAACSPGTALGPQAPATSVAADERAGTGPTFTERVVYNFPLDAKRRSALFPSGSLLAGERESFYGTTSATAGFRGGDGTVFELTRRRSIRVISRTARKQGSLPLWGVIADASGALYGTTREGGDLNCFDQLGCGTVFKLKPEGALYDKETLHRFSGGTDGAEPTSGLTLDSGGSLYGTTASGGGTNCGGNGCGTVYRLTPSGARYREAIVYRFRGGSDGNRPMGGVVLDAAGNLYGVTARGGVRCVDSSTGCGTVYELMRGSSGYSKVVLHRFRGSVLGDGAIPAASLIRRADGALYGTTLEGGKAPCTSSGCGTVFELTRSGSEYQERVLMNFAPAPGNVLPEPSALLSHDGELFGTTSAGGRFTSYFFPHGCGLAFVVDPRTGAARIIHEFRGPPHDGAAPSNGVIRGPDDALYGATARGGTGGCLEFSGCGTIFRLAALAGPAR